MFVSIYICAHQHSQYSQRPEGALDPLDLNHHVCAGNQTQILCKSKQPVHLTMDLTPQLLFRRSLTSQLFSIYYHFLPFKVLSLISRNIILARLDTPRITLGNWRQKDFKFQEAGRSQRLESASE